MFDHIGLKVSDLAASITFYEAALGALGHGLASSGDDYAGFGPDGAPALWLHQYGKGINAGAHVALRAADREAVQRFHAQGLAAGGRDNGAPGPRPDYGATYYAAFLLDPDGHNIEAVCFV
ncbi:VOC family protein [Roseateles toxinivorans]|uniref:Catechol 2,3-dioxygenase-like lactoylglutathione lyase family enzyme n=1 Tax=Roseateles toxinivorans TaxID=270368 RepID=A0A4R6QS43_9BURK|nr:VOC family protein [Roseateles toxinivorans]TDP74137.1 catechol 2,3-dioxygenase-like lactoylglutathione lyase family enzyme [Roseateles toxinivorans]